MPLVIKLSWVTPPASEDLDAHLWVPNGASGYREIYFGNKGSSSAYPWAKLDDDNTTGTGTEHVTIYQMEAGTYAFAVHSFSCEAPLTESSAKVNIYRGDELLAALAVPETGSGEWWDVFRLGEDDTILPVNGISDTPPYTSEVGNTCGWGGWGGASSERKRKP